MWKPKNLVEALLPIFIINLLFGHGVLQYLKIKKSGVIYNLIFSILGLVGYLTCLILTTYYWIENSWMLAYKIDYFIIFLNVVIMVFNIILGWIHKNRKYIIYLKNIKIEEIISTIGEPIDNQRAFRYSLAVSICWIITSLLLSYNRIAWFKMNIPLIHKVAIIFVTQYPHYINLLTDLIFCLSINHIKIRFESLNKVLKTFVSDENFENQIFTSDNLFSTRSKKTNEDKWAIRKSENVDVIKIIQTIKYLHLELGILSGEFMKTYGLQLILGIIASFGQITHVFLFIYFVVRTKSQSTNDRIIQTAGSIVTVVINSFKMIFVNRICSETILEYQKTGELIHKLEIQTEDIKLKKEIQQFSIQILQNPLIFSPCGLLNLGYPFIKDFTGAVTAQLLILIQTSDETTVLYSSFNETAVNDA